MFWRCTSRSRVDPLKKRNVGTLLPHEPCLSTRNQPTAQRSFVPTGSVFWTLAREFQELVTVSRPEQPPVCEYVLEILADASPSSTTRHRMSVSSSKPSRRTRVPGRVWAGSGTTSHHDAAAANAGVAGRLMTRHARTTTTTIR